MPLRNSSLITLQNFSKSFVENLFSEALLLKQKYKNNQCDLPKYSQISHQPIAALLFFEASTRTRFSFEIACIRAGIKPIVLDGVLGTSLEKGESVLDTILNIQAMNPDLFIIRCGENLNLLELQQQIKSPIINAGWGTFGHPTQALLDACTLFEEWKTLENKKILFVGDVKHSRVVASHIQLAQILGAQIGFCAPSDFLSSPVTQNNQNDIEIFEKLEKALPWADAVVALRLQKERHDSSQIFILEDYIESYCLNQQKLNLLSSNSFILHPGPVNYGIEIDNTNNHLHTDSRCKIFNQVENSVFIRQILVERSIKGVL